MHNIETTIRLVRCLGTALITALLIVMLSIKASSQTNVLRIEDFTGLGMDDRFACVSGQPHIVEYQNQFTGSFQHVHGSTIIVHTACPMPPEAGYYYLSFRYQASHPMSVYAVSTSGARKHIGTVQPFWAWSDFFVSGYFYFKKMVRIEMETATTADCKLFEFDEFTLTYAPTLPDSYIKVVDNGVVMGFKPARDE